MQFRPTCIKKKKQEYTQFLFVVHDDRFANKDSTCRLSMLQRSVNHVIMMVTDDIDDAIRLW